MDEYGYGWDDAWEIVTHLFAYTNEKYLSGAPKALVLSFHGLGYAQMPREHSDFSLACAGRGILLAAPYDSPWSWMNDTAVKTVDAIVDALFFRHNAKDIPLISTGGSMGGLSALIYARYSAHPVAACAARTYSCSRRERICPRTSLAMETQ